VPGLLWRERIVADHEETLCRVALNDHGFIGSVLAMDGGNTKACRLDQRTNALVRLGSLVAVGAADATYQWCVDEAMAAGATVDEVVGTLFAVTPTVGLARVVAAAPKIGRAVGYDIDVALETLDDEP